MSSHVMSGDVFNNPLAKIDPGAMLLKKAFYRPDKPPEPTPEAANAFVAYNQPQMQMQNQMQNQFQQQNAQQLLPMHQGLLAMRQRGR